MKRTFSTASSSRFLALLALLICFSTVSANAQKNETKKPSKQEIFFQKVEQIKPGMSQTEVKDIMGEPYKRSFELKDDGQLEESIFYQTAVWNTRWTLIVYECVFKNDKLTALKQKEYLYQSDNPIGI